MEKKKGSKRDLRKRCFSTCAETKDNGKSPKRKRRHSISTDPSPEKDRMVTPTVIVSPKYSQRTQRANVIRRVQSRSQAMPSSRRRCKSTMLPQSRTDSNGRNRYFSSTVHHTPPAAAKKLNLPQQRKRCQSATVLPKKTNQTAEVIKKKRCVSARIRPERIEEETPENDQSKTKQTQYLTTSPIQKHNQDENASPGTRRRFSLSEVSEPVTTATRKRCKSLTRHIQSLEIKA